jgi:hypothetical protein
VKNRFCNIAVAFVLMFIYCNSIYINTAVYSQSFSNREKNSEYFFVQIQDVVMSSITKSNITNHAFSPTIPDILINYRQNVFSFDVIFSKIINSKNHNFSSHINSKSVFRDFLISIPFHYFY